MTLAQIQSHDIGRIIADAGNTAEIGGTTYNCVVSTVSIRKPMEDGGFILEPNIDIVCLASDFGGTLPVIGAKATVNAQEFRIISREVSFTGAQVTFRCETANR